MTELAGRARVLVVDDDRFQRELVRDQLAERAEVVTCADAGEALAALRAAPADLILADLAMPGRSGLELLQQVLRDHPGTDFVIVTANASVPSAVEALRMGAADYLEKPVRADDLILVLERTLGRRRLLAENRRLRDELSLYQSCRLLSTCLEPEDVFAVGLELTLRGVGAGRGFALYRRTALPGSEGFHGRGFTEPEELSLRQAFATKPLVLDRSAELQRQTRGEFHQVLEGLGIRARELLVIPIAGEEAEGGVLCLLAEGEPFGAHDLERAQVVAEHAALALRNAERYRAARDRAFIDDVTEVYNARYLLEALDREIRRAERYGTELSILFLDLDRFKLVNDTHGHLVGSNTLRQLSRLLEGCVRQVDTVARYGGDEFTILLVDTGERVGRAIAERIRQSVERHAFEAGPGRTLRLSCSLGISTYPAHGRTREALLDTSDKAMYRAKSQGRNRVVSASELD
ncbi:MAG: diguanylate cyclase [Myxococcota bacterium]